MSLEASGQPTPEPRSSWGLETFTKLVALLGASVALVYIAGGLILALKLRNEQLPWNAVVGHLPREFLISIGIAELIVPAILIAVIVAAFLIGVRWIWEMDPHLAKPLQWVVEGIHAAATNRTVRVIATTVGILIATFAVAASVAAVDGAPLVEDGPPQEPRAWIVLLAGLGTLSLLVLVAAAVDKAFTAWRPRWEWKVLLVAVVIAFVLAPVRIAADLQTKPLPSVLVCMTDPRSPGGSEARLKRGLLIGETSDRVYVGEPARTHQIGNPERQAYSTDTNRIASLPWTHIQKLYIARNPPGDTCAPVAHRQ